jgi:hypothetical protein
MDKIVISWILLIMMSVAYIVPIGLPIKIRTPSEKFYKFIESLPKDSKPLLMSIDFTAGGAPEIYPSMLAVVRHCIARGLRIVVVGIGTDEATVLMHKLFEESGIAKVYRYGVDYVGIGYIPGGEMAITTLATDFQKIVKSDAYGNKISDLPLTRDIKDYNDFSAVIPFDTAGVLTLWVRNWTPLKVPFFASMTAGYEPTFVPFYNAGLIQGYLAGISGGAEYELLSGFKGSAIKSMDMQSITHLYAVILIIAGLIIPYLRKRR